MRIDIDWNRVAKLPDWAFTLIKSLFGVYVQAVNDLKVARGTIERLEEQIRTAAEGDTGPDDSTAWLWHQTDEELLSPLGLGADAAIDFTPTGKHGVQITVTVEQGGIKVTSAASLAIIPLTGRGELIIKPV